jgi:hypothetical protein
MSLSTMKARFSLLRPLTQAAQDWIDENLALDRRTFCDSVAIEHRYIFEIVTAILCDGLAVR